MYIASFLSLYALVPALVLAAPSPTVEARQSCSTAYPDFARISEAQPVQSYLPGFIISQSTGATFKNDMLIEFEVPEGANTCQLETFFPAGYDISKFGRQDVYVYSVDENLSRSPRGIDNSWDFSPDIVSQVGTIRFESDPNQDTRRVINSFVCKPTLTYRLSIGRDFTDFGYVSYVQQEGAGLRLTYCT